MSNLDLLESLDKVVHSQCKLNHQKWKLEVESITRKYSPLADGLIERVERFTTEHTASFYKNYKDKVAKALTEKVAAIHHEIIARHNPNISKNTLSKLDFKTEKNRMWLEAYFLNNKNIRQAAASISISKSTYHDWICKNSELIQIEENQRNSVLKERLS